MIKAFVDNQLLHKLCSSSEQEAETFVSNCREAGLLKDEQTLQILFGWSSIFELIGLEDVLKQLPKFDSESSFFKTVVALLSSNLQKDDITNLYDEMFVECLVQIKNLAQIHPTFLLEQIQKKRQELSSSVVSNLFSFSLNNYENLLRYDPYQAAHNLTLYLAWDRMCVYSATVFEQINLNDQTSQSLNVIQECLIESFQHITLQRKTQPGFFRLVEAIYAYQMREEKFTSYTETEWLTLSQGAQALKARESLPDVFYIDAAIAQQSDLANLDMQPLLFFTLDSSDRVNACLNLSHYVLNQLKQQTPSWEFTFCPIHVFCLKEKEQGFIMGQTIKK